MNNVLIYIIMPSICDSSPLSNFQAQLSASAAVPPPLPHTLNMVARGRLRDSIKLTNDTINTNTYSTFNAAISLWLSPPILNGAKYRF